MQLQPLNISSANWKAENSLEFAERLLFLFFLYLC